MTDRDFRAFEAIVIGSGLAAQSAALAIARTQSTVAYVEDSWAPNIKSSPFVDPNPLAPEGKSGHAMWWDWWEQFRAAGGELPSAVLLEPDDVTVTDAAFVVAEAGEPRLTTQRLVFAVEPPRPLPVIPGVLELLGRGVSEDAWSDAPFFNGRTVAVVGDGDAALEQALVAAEHAARVVVLLERELIQRETLVRAVASHPRIEIARSARVLSLRAGADGHMQFAEVECDGTRKMFECSALFLAFDPVMTAALQQTMTRLRLESERCENLRLAFAGTINDVRFDDHAALVRDGLRAASQVMTDTPR